MQPIDALAQAADQGRRVALVIVLAVEGDAPSHAGAKLVADNAGPIAGTLGCSEFDAAGLDLARLALNGQRTVRRRLEFPGPRPADPLRREGSDMPSSSPHGEQRVIELFAEVQEPAPGIVVIGGTPVGRAIAAVAIAVGRRVQLLTTEPETSDHPGLRIVPGDPAARLHERGLRPADAVVISDHDAPYVDEVLRVALLSPAGFVGMLGSRRHAPDAVRRLADRGVAAEHLARLRSPCGLDIGSRTPGEIALSIVAEIVAHERGRSGGPMGLDWSQT